METLQLLFHHEHNHNQNQNQISEDANVSDGVDVILIPEGECLSYDGDMTGRIWLDESVRMMTALVIISRVIIHADSLIKIVFSFIFFFFCQLCSTARWILCYCQLRFNRR